MDWRFTFFLLSMLISLVFGWQLALFFPPQDYQFAGWAIAGAGTLICLVGAAK
jgi:hypothetical protein